MSDPDFRDPDRFPEGVPEDEGDFADEHSDTTLADQLTGGPESANEPETPRGRAGMD
jgi:hypothetical protein